MPGKVAPTTLQPVERTLASCSWHTAWLAWSAGVLCGCLRRTVTAALFFLFFFPEAEAEVKTVDALMERGFVRMARMHVGFLDEPVKQVGTLRCTAAALTAR